MKRIKIFAMTAVVTLGMAPATFAANNGAGFTAHHLVPKEDYANYAKSLPADDKIALRQYLDYEQREQCQGYQRPPKGFTKTPDLCNIGFPHPQRVAMTTTLVPRERMAMRPVIRDYDVNFDFDKANIRPASRDTIANALQDIRRLNPTEVTVVGHADTSGPEDYNMKLSQARAQNVSRALSQEGIPNRVINQEAVGESDLAVPTNDGVKLEENRRVNIQLRS